MEKDVSGSHSSIQLMTSIVMLVGETPMISIAHHVFIAYMAYPRVR